jgi:nucleoid-associated protein YgaU
MGLFNFGRDSGRQPKTPVRPGAEQANAAELAADLRALGITIEAGRITVQGDAVTISGVADSQAEREKAVLVLGNTKGVGRVVDQIQVRAPASQPVQTAAPASAPSQFYEVKTGDSLSKIAKQFYGDAGQYSAIFEANRPMLKDPDEIFPGQVLRIPPRH